MIRIKIEKTRKKELNKEKTRKKEIKSNKA